MIKYIQDNFSLTSVQRQMLYKNGQAILDQIKAEGGFIKVFCRNRLPSYLTEDDWINLYQTKIISYEYQKIVDGLCIQKPYFINETELLENWNSETLDFIKQQTNIINLPKNSIEMIQLMFGFNILKKQYGFNNIIDDQKSQKQLTLNDFLENQTNHDYQQIAKVSISRKTREFKYIKHFLPLSLKPSSINDALSYLRVDINGINKPQIEFNQNEHWIKQSLQFACFYYININVGQNICEWITINEDQFDNLKIKVQELFNISIMTDKTAWLKSEEFLLENNIKFTYIEQNPADIIILKPGTYAFAKPTNGLSINLSWHQASYNKEQFTYLLNQFIKFDNLNKNIPIKNFILDIMIHEKNFEKVILDELKKYLSICILDENQLIKSFNLMQAPKYQEKKEDLFCIACEKEIFIYFYFDKEIFCLQCGKQKQNYNLLNIKIRYRFHCLNYLINSEEQICSTEFCSIYLGKTKCALQNKEKQEDEIKQKNSKNSRNYISSQIKEQYNDDISSMSDYQQYKCKNQKLNQFNHFTALKKLKIE